MGTGWRFKRKHRRRPIKSALERARRYKVQRQRLVSRGMEAAQVAKLEPFELRALLKRPNRMEKTARRMGIAVSES